MSYSEDYRKRTIEYRGEGHTLEETHKVFKVSISTTRTWEKQWKEKGTLAPAPVVRGYKKIEPEKLKAYVQTHPGAYLEEIAGIASEQIAYVDETGINTYLYREYGYALKGQKVNAAISGREYKRVEIIAAQLNQEIISPLAYSGTMDSSMFEFWFEKQLLPHFLLVLWL